MNTSTLLGPVALEGEVGAGRGDRVAWRSGDEDPCDEGAVGVGELGGPVVGAEEPVAEHPASRAVTAMPASALVELVIGPFPGSLRPD
jgi:hypothetical protein